MKPNPIESQRDDGCFDKSCRLFADQTHHRIEYALNEHALMAHHV